MIMSLLEGGGNGDGEGEWDWSTNIDVESPMPACIDNQPIPQASIRNETFVYHLRQEHNHGIIVSLSRHIHRNLNPPIFAHTLPFPFPTSLIPSHLLILPLAHTIVPALAPHSRRFLNFSLHAHNRLRAVGETQPRAAVGRGQEVGFGDQGAERGRGAAVGADGWREGEGGV